MRAVILYYTTIAVGELKQTVYANFQQLVAAMRPLFIGMMAQATLAIVAE